MGNSRYKAEPSNIDLSLLVPALSASDAELSAYRVTRHKALTSIRKNGRAGADREHYESAANELIRALMAHIEQQICPSPRERQVWRETLSDLLLDL